MTEQPDPDTVDPENAPVAGGSGDGPAGDPEPGSRDPLSAEEGEPDIEPFAGDDDILSGHIGTDD